MTNFNSKNKLKQIIRVQEEYMKHANSGRTTAYIYRTYIHPHFLISRGTFYRYLTIPARRELMKLEADEKSTGT